MSSEFIGSIGISSSKKNSSSTNHGLSVETQKALEELGVSIAGITTEEQGSAALAIAQAEVEESKKLKTQTIKGRKNNLTMQVKLLANKVGVTLNQDEDMQLILSKISYTINKLRIDAKNDQVKAAKLAYYQMEYNTIYASYLETLNSQAQLSKTMNHLASYNKIYQNLS